MDKMPIFSRNTGLSHDRDDLLEIGDVLADEEGTWMVTKIGRRENGTPRVEVKGFCRSTNFKLLTVLQ